MGLTPKVRTQPEKMAPYSHKLLHSRQTADPTIIFPGAGSNRISTHVESNSQSSVSLEINRIYHLAVAP